MTLVNALRALAASATAGLTAATLYYPAVKLLPILLASVSVLGTFSVPAVGQLIQPKQVPGGDQTK